MSRARQIPNDQPVRDRIATVFDRNFLVEAGAGSGKTQSLATRMAAGIERGHYRVEHMAAVTFTRKAAAELRGRFQLALEQRLAEATGRVERERLEAALAGIERLFAGTIHAFCAHLLRERPVDARIAPGFEELGESEASAMRKRAWRDYVAEARASGFKAMLDLLEAGIRPQDLDNAFAAVCEHEDVEFDIGGGSPPRLASVWRQIDQLWKDLSALRPAEFLEETTCKIQQRFHEYEGRIRVARRDRLASLAGFLKAWGKPKVTQYCWGAEAGLDAANGKKVATLVKTFNESVAQPFMQEFEAYVHHLAMQVLLAARDYYATVRRRQNAVNYVDLLRVTARTLAENPHVRRALQQKYRWLFIDEFQDTDPIQAEIFLWLAASEPDSGAGQGLEVEVVDPFTLPLRPGALFVVGDPKQSIFRFRRADIDIYTRVGQRIEQTGGERLSLTANFRSRPGVCRVANTVFPELFGALTQPYSPAFEALDPVREDDAAEETLPAVARLTTSCEKDDYVQQEAEAIARYIEAEVAADRRKYGEFLVLTRQRPRLAAIADVFDSHGIPLEVSGGGSFLQSSEVRALALLLTALADPLDSVSLVGVLRGPLFGLSDPELFQYRQAGGRFELTAPLPSAENPAANAKLQEAWGPALDAMRRLQEMQRLTWTLPAGAVVDRILEDTGWLALAGTAAGAVRAGHLVQAVDCVRQVVEEGGGLAAAAEALVADEGAADADALPLQPGRRDVVRLMNLHKAKGLEAGVTFLADATHGFQFPVTLRVTRIGTKATGHLRIARQGQYPWLLITVGQPRDWETHEVEELRYVEAERLRLMYVAATRAKDLLVVCRFADAKSNKAWDVFEGYLAGVPELDVPTERPKTKKVAAAKVSAADRRAAAAERQAVCDRITAPSWAVASVTTKAERGVSRRSPEAEGGDADDVHAAARRIDAGAAWGSLVHGLLEHAARNTHSTRADLQRLAGWLVAESPELMPAIPDALDLVERVVAAPFWKDVRQAEDVQVEVPFAIAIPVGRTLGGLDPATVPTVLRGVIDLAYRASDGWRILDYKTDVSLAPGETLLSRHYKQLACYGAAWEQSTSEDVIARGIVSARTGIVEWDDLK